MNRSHILKRLRFLRNMEALNIFLLPSVLALHLALSPAAWPLFSFAMGCMCWVLAQGAYYWHLKLSAVSCRTGRLPSYFPRLFLFFRRLNVALFAIYLFVAAILWQSSSVSKLRLLLASALATFAVLEHINYYHYQLKHDTANDLRYLLRYRRFRRACLAVDIDRTRLRRLAHGSS